jgi:peroxiredoxin
MRRELALSVVAAGAAAVVVGALVAMLTPASHEPMAASAERDAPSRIERDAPSPARVSDRPAAVASARVGASFGEAVRELDLIRPPRPRRAEDFTVTLMRGDTLKLGDQRGKAVMVNFWATWCPPCREEMPAMERLYRRHRERGFVLLAVSVDTDAALVKPFLEGHKLTFPVALDPTMGLANAYGVRALPASFLIDRDGYLAALALGPRAWDNRAAHALVEGMLAP